MLYFFTTSAIGLLLPSEARTGMPRELVALAAIDVENMAGDVGSSLRRDKDDRVGKLFREAEPGHRNGRHQSCLVLRRACEAGQHAGVRRTGCHGIDTDSRLSKLERHRLGDAFDGMLAAYVDGGAGRALVSISRGDVDDSPAALYLHDARLVLHAQEYAENIGVERRGIAFGGLLRDRAGFTFGAGIIDRDIETPEALDGAVDETTDIVFLAHIGLDEFGFGTERTELANQCLTGIRLAPRNNNAIARFRERDRSSAADAGEGTSDEND